MPKPRSPKNPQHAVRDAHRAQRVRNRRRLQKQMARRNREA